MSFPRPNFISSSSSSPPPPPPSSSFPNDVTMSSTTETSSVLDSKSDTSLLTLPALPLTNHPPLTSSSSSHPTTTSFTTSSTHTTHTTSINNNNNNNNNNNSGSSNNNTTSNSISNSPPPPFFTSSDITQLEEPFYTSIPKPPLPQSTFTSPPPTSSTSSPSSNSNSNPNNNPNSSTAASVLNLPLLQQYLTLESSDEAMKLLKLSHIQKDSPGLLASRTAWIKQNYDLRAKFSFFSTSTQFVQGQSLPQVQKAFQSNEPFWLDVYQPNDLDLRLLALIFHIHPLTIEDMMSDDEIREKCEVFDKYLFLCLQTLAQEDPFVESFYYLLLFPWCVVSVRFTPLIHPLNVLIRLLTTMTGNSTSFTSSSLLNSSSSIPPTSFSPFSPPPPPPPSSTLTSTQNSTSTSSTTKHPPPPNTTSTTTSTSSSSNTMMHHTSATSLSTTAASLAYTSIHPTYSSTSTSMTLPASFKKEWAPDWIVYAILDDIMDGFLPVIKALELDVDCIDDLVLILNSNEQEDMLTRIRSASKKVTQFMRLLHFKDEVVKSFANRSSHYVQQDTLWYLRDIQDHIVTLHQSLQIAKENLHNAHNIYLSQVSVELSQLSITSNKIMNRISLQGFLFVPLTFVTGLFGMNVDLPFENGDRNLLPFYGILGVMAGFVLIMIFVAWRYRIY